MGGVPGLHSGGQKPIITFIPKVQLKTAASVDRFSRRSISNGGQCAYCFVEESIATFAHDVSLANKQAANFEDVKGNIHTP
jgi:hypothetical protein